MRDEIAVVDYGSGNIHSITNALRRVAGPDRTVVLTRDPAAIAAAERIVLPGVGAFAECSRKLADSGLLPAIQDAVRQGRPLLGICVGMQILASEGLEFERYPGLGWLGGVVRQLRFPEGYEGPRKLPHIGWSPVELTDSPLFEGLPRSSHFYFVHSFVFDGDGPTRVVATATYGETFPAAVLHQNIFGCQFHPEKSDQPGLRLLENYCRWTP